MLLHIGQTGVKNDNGFLISSNRHTTRILLESFDVDHLFRGIATEIGYLLERRQAAAERQQLEAQIQHADRLATIGQLAAGVAQYGSITRRSRARKAAICSRVTGSMGSYVVSVVPWAMPSP